MITRSEIMLSLQDALIGEIYNNIRAIVFDYNEDNKTFLLRFYLDKEPDEDDFESVSIVMSEFISHFKFSEFNTINEECLYSKLQLSELEPLSGVVYARKELMK
ncbi:MAG: colicin [Candidatus Kapabacteria bacterium]|jgi:hypothetical protein|nr:colicin [Candidatus Kapabacteria bacterium]